jgi:hypothetical protein
MSPEASEENAWWRRWASILAACLVLIAATRWPLEPTRHLYGATNVDFALALDDFSPARFQPPPPGDPLGAPLYVALTRWMRPFVPTVELLFPVSGVLGSAAAMAALWWVAEMMFGTRAGALAGLLLGLNPIFWLAGVADYAHVYAVLGAAVVAGLVWKSLDTSSNPSSKKSSAVYFCASTAALGFFAGFRLELGLLLAPLVLFPAWRRRAAFQWWHWLAAAVCGAATILPWLPITARSSGGFLQWCRLSQEYSSGRVSGTATLIAIPAVCLLGAGVLTRLPARWFWWSAPVAVAVSAGLFFFPSGSSNYSMVEHTKRTAEQVYARVGLLEKMGPVTVLTHGASITPREIGYYFPRVPILDLGSPPAANVEMVIRAGRVIWLDPVAPADARCFDSLREALGGETGSEGPVHWANLPGGVRFRVGRQSIVAR